MFTLVQTNREIDMDIYIRRKTRAQTCSGNGSLRYDLCFPNTIQKNHDMEVESIVKCLK